MEEKKVNNKPKRKMKKVVIFIFLLIMIIIALVMYILVDKKIINVSFVGDQEKEKIIPQEKVVYLSVDDVSVLDLYLNAHYNFNIAAIDQFVFNNNKLTIEDMDAHYKIGLAANIFYDKVEYSNIPGEESYRISYDDVKFAYEKIFGPNTFNHLDKFDLNCGSFDYDANKREYVNKTSGCGGITFSWVAEYPISARKYNDRIEITSASVFYQADTAVLYKDYNHTNEIGLLSSTESDVWNELKRYVKDNKDNLEQYTYTFQLNDDGFYYYIGVEKTQK